MSNIHLPPNGASSKGPGKWSLDRNWWKLKLTGFNGNVYSAIYCRDKAHKKNWLHYQCKITHMETRKIKVQRVRETLWAMGFTLGPLVKLDQEIMFKGFSITYSFNIYQWALGSRGAQGCPRMSRPLLIGLQVHSPGSFIWRLISIGR